MAALVNQSGPVMVFVCVLSPFHLVSPWVQAVQSMYPQSKIGVSGLSPGSNMLAVFLFISVLIIDLKMLKLNRVKFYFWRRMATTLNHQKAIPVYISVVQHQVAQAGFS